MKDERGITMIALALTIVVLSIITAVSIRQITVNNSEAMKEIINETDYQEEMVQDEKDKMDNVIDRYEEDWGLS